MWTQQGESQEHAELRVKEFVHVHADPYEAMKKTHAIAVLTEWDEFKTYDWEKGYDNMQRPAFVFDGRNILDAEELRKLGFEVKSIGKG